MIKNRFETQTKMTKSGSQKEKRRPVSIGRKHPPVFRALWTNHHKKGKNRRERKKEREIKAVGCCCENERNRSYLCGKYKSRKPL